MDYVNTPHAQACSCPACTGYGGDRGELLGTEGFSLDPQAGGTYAGKPIFNLGQITANLNRSGLDWYTNNYNELDDGVLNFGFWANIQEIQSSYYVNDDGTLAFSEANPATFSAFSAAQQTVTRNVIGLWDDLVDISFQESTAPEADITYGNSAAGAGVQAYAYLPFGDTYDAYYAEYFNWSEIGRVGGDVWIGGNVGSNFFPLQESYYSVITLIHETGHALGLSHPGAYNAGGGQVFSYANNAEFAQDSLQYSVMSYFDAYETGAQHIDWTLANFAYSATPLVHDIATIQAMYGTDTTTRTGDTVYGFNSTADRTAFDFTINTRPIVAIWDAGGIDTLDFSGWDTPSIMDLNEGAFSSGGGIEEFLTLEQVNANRAALGFGPRSQATWNFYEGLKAQLGLTNGLFHDNISIAYGVTIENATGGGGDDVITGNTVANVLIGNAGNDTIMGGTGADTLNGGIGIDTVSYADSSAKVSVNLGNNKVSGGTATKDIISNFENIMGSDFDDTLTGDNFANVIHGGDGADAIAGSNGDDDLHGDAGNDSLRGGSGKDKLNGGDGNDTLLGENGDDLIFGGADNDVLNGGNGNDTLDGEGGDNTLVGGSGNDIFTFSIVDGGKDIISDFRKGADKIDVSDIDAILGGGFDAFTFIGGAEFSAAGQLRTAFLDAGGFSLLGDLDGNGVADLVINLTGVTSLAATDIIFA